MLRIFFFSLFLALSSVLWSQDISVTQQSLSPKEKAQQLLNELEENTNKQIEQSNKQEQSLTELSSQVESLKVSLKETLSLSEDLGNSLKLSELINSISIPVAIVSTIVAAIELFLFIK